MRVVVRDLTWNMVELSVSDGLWTATNGGEMLDLSDLWSLPGLADAHVHLTQDTMVLEPGDPPAIRRRAFTCLEQGVFLCLDKGWSDTAVLQLLDEPPTERPDLQAAGRMLAGHAGYFPDFAVEVGEDDLAQAVSDAAADSAGWVKIVGDWPRPGMGAVPSFGEEALRRAVEVAHAAEVRVAIHTMAPDTPSMAVRAGVDSIEHGLFLTDDDIRLLGSRQGALVPTVARVEQVIEDLGRDRTGGRLLSQGLDRLRSLMADAVVAGVAVLAGSDLALPPGQVAAEALRLWDSGLTAEQAVASVGEAAYRYAGVEAGFASGLPADVVAFERHPVEDPTVLTTPVVVLRRGRILVDRRR